MTVGQFSHYNLTLEFKLVIVILANWSNFDYFKFFYVIVIVSTLFYFQAIGFNKFKFLNLPTAQTSVCKCAE